uniref:Methyl-CpG-binding domain-containing protein 2-like n=1 Tax=Nelumbo nucifera TaxID=4432 RepID=A0A822Y693_NELNU|nr:TPA_asm: hypothetical protein HUJ06_029220 [Nelumbo nucifera]
MWSHHGDASTKLKKEKDELIESSSPSCLGNTIEKPGYDSTLEGEEEEETQVNEDEDDQSNRNTSKQLVLYDPEATPTGQIQPSHEPVSYQPPPLPTCSTRNPLSRALPSIGAFTVQCANCFKWRLIPTKEKYEEIRESILQKPFVCETAREWRPDISCDDPADISQDGSRLWAIDKPNIAQPPLGWERLLRIRGEGSTKFADVYYVSPSGKRLRSMVEVQRYLLEHPEYTDAGVTMAQFSFQTPRPLQENYVRKRPAPVAPSYDESDLGISRPIEPRDDLKRLYHPWALISVGTFSCSLWHWLYVCKMQNRNRRLIYYNMLFFCSESLIMGGSYWFARARITAWWARAVNP